MKVIFFSSEPKMCHPLELTFSDIDDVELTNTVIDSSRKKK